MDKSRCFVIENKETEKRYLLTFNNWAENGTPKGYARITSCLPLSSEYHNLPIYKGAQDIKMRVYFDGDCDWYASPWELEKTRQWIIENYQLDDDFELEECDLDNDCMWYETTNKKDIEELGDYDERCKGGIGDLRRGIGDKSIAERLMTFKEVLKFQGSSKEPYIIATTNY